MSDGHAAAPQSPMDIITSRRFVVLLVLAAAIGVIASLVAWGFLELVFNMQDWVYDDLPDVLGFNDLPWWWPLPVLTIAGLITAFAIAKLPGTGGHIPADGLSAAPTSPIEVPGVIVAAVASIGLGAVIGPEAPLIAIGGGIGLLAARVLVRSGGEEVGAVLGASAAFAALGFLFGSPIMAAVVLIEAAGIAAARLPLVLIPGLVASGIGSLVWIGMGSWTGLSTDDISINPLKLPHYGAPDLTDFAWTVPLAAAIAIGTLLIFRLAHETLPHAQRRPFLVIPACGLLIGGLAVGFQLSTDKDLIEVLYSGEESIGSLVADADEWSLSALALLIAFKGAAYGLSLAGFRGGPVFPALFLGAAAGMMAAMLPGFELTPAVAVGIGAAVAAVLRLPLTAALLAVLLTLVAGSGTGPLIIVGVVVAYLVSSAIAPKPPPEAPGPGGGEAQPAASG